jgi:DNA modification methylase
VTVYYTDDAVTLYHGDCIEVMRSLPSASVDAVVTDPPYGLEFMGREWDAPWKSSGTVEASIAEGADESHPYRDGSARIRYGRGGSSSAAFGDWCELWATECLRVLKPGGHLLAFGGSRTWHRLAVAVEDAGFEIRDSIAWLYGSGFPKSLDVSKAIDKHLTPRAPRTLEYRFTDWARSTGVTSRQINDDRLLYGRPL